MFNSKISRVLFFDISRILAILLVVLAHISQAAGIPYLNRFFGIPNFYWVSLGGIGVTLFLIVSGSVLAYNYGEIIPIKKLKQFYTNRIIRLYPSYWISIIVILFIFLILIPGYITKLSVTNILLTFSGLYVFMNQWGGPIMTVSWFIGLILSLYLIYPILNYMFNKHTNYTLLLLLILSIVSRIICGQLQSNGVGNRLVDWFPLCRIFEFGLGVYIVKTGLYIKKIEVSESLSKIIVLLSNISFPVYLIHYSFFDGQFITALHITSLTPLYYKIEYVIVALIVTLIISFGIYYIDMHLQKLLRYKFNSTVKNTT